jgi:hypothetical protein
MLSSGNRASCKVVVVEVSFHAMKWKYQLMLHRKKDFLKIQEYTHEGANLKLYIPEFFNFKLYIPEYSPI